MFEKNLTVKRVINNNICLLYTSHMWEAFKETAPEEFTLYPLVYSAKKQSPIAKLQKAYLNDLLKYHRIETNIRIEDMTRSEASRMIDKIILQYGRIPGRERKEREKRI